MVRILFAGQDAAASVQQTLSRPVDSKSAPTTAQSKTQNGVQRRSNLAAEEQLSLKQQQSLEMVQIMLHVSIGTLFYLREFLPLACFDDRDLKQALRENKFSYREFINGKDRSDKSAGTRELAFGQGKRGQPLKIIIRHSDPKADMLLDVLEHGIFDALNKKVLEAIQLNVLVDKEAPSNVLESYTFSFKYSGRPGDVDSRLESLCLDPVGCVADMKSAQTARMDKRNLAIHLFYTDSCPREYDPPGFSAGEGYSLNYPLTENWKRESQSCGIMNSGFHTVGLKVTSLKWTGPDPEGLETPPKIPEQIEYRDTVSRFADMGFEDEENGPGGRNESGSFNEATQDIAEREKLQRMIPTQRMSPTPDSDLVPTQPVNPIAALGRDGKASDKESVILSANKAAEINKYIKPNIMENASPQSRPIRCQCAWDGEEPEMIECSFCHSRQHLLCYGYRNSDDSKIPDIHACYQCLLGQSEPQLLREMHTLVLLRRALGIILTEGFQNKISVFSQRLHCNGNTVLQITDLLKKRGFIQPTHGYKRKGFPQSGLPKYHIPHSEEVNQKIQNEVFDPLVKIGHHYSIRVVDESTGMSKTIQPGISSSPNSQDEDISMDGPGMGEQTQEPNDSLQTPQMTTRKRKQTNSAQSSDIIKASQSEHTYQKDDNLPDLQNTSLDTTGPETPSSHQTSLEGGVRRSGRKRRRISNYKRLIDVGVASSSDEESNYRRR
ncbi:meiosis specific protein Hop1 [Aspergillus sclerotialis]|uniref:Meiosis specific protein Hop1 n=1 Tax=Aspergillus sclerotialis TaxID=2070753 RepID=A0A3A2ZBP0_9EURO|nr:meiosis specific protein Hop1 [Aspergillus sclerotialis]